MTAETTQFETGWEYDGSLQTWRPPRTQAAVAEATVETEASDGGSIATLGYAAMTTHQTGITTEVALTELRVTVTVAAGRRVRVSASIHGSSDQADNGAQVRIKQDGVEVQFAQDNPSVAGARFPLNPSVVLTPTEGQHVYTVTMLRTGASNIVRADSWSTDPSYLLVEDITGTPTPFNPLAVPVGQIAYNWPGHFDQGFFSAETTITGMSVNVVTDGARRFRITVRGSSYCDASTARVAVRLKEGAAQLALTRLNIDSTSSWPYHLEYVATPSAGSHTYSVTMARETGTGNVAHRSLNDEPGYILVEDITPTPATTSTAPSSTLGYAERTTDQTAITTVVDLTGLSTTVTVQAGRRIKITGRIWAFASTIANDEGRLSIKEGANMLQVSDVVLPKATGLQMAHCEVILTPSVGQHTYKLTAERKAGTGTLTAHANPAAPAYILVEDITGVGVPYAVSTGFWAPSNEFPANPVYGDLFYETDTDKLWVWRGAWTQLIDSGAYDDFTPVHNWTGGVALVANWTRKGRHISADYRFTISGAVAGGNLLVDLPVQARYGDHLVGFCYHAGLTFQNPAVCRTGGGGTSFFVQDNTAFINNTHVGAGDFLTIHLEYQSQF